jgi:hypothetical protein
MNLATRWTTARQLFGLSRYKAGQLQVPCSAVEEDPEPRPTNPRAAPGISLSQRLWARENYLRQSAFICG